MRKKVTELVGSQHIPKDVQALANATLSRDRFDVQADGSVVTENILRVKKLIFHPGSKLKVGEHTDAWSIVWADEVVFQDGSKTCLIEVPAPNVRHARPGSPAGSSGAPGRNGGNGANAGDGTVGAPLPKFVFYTNSIDFVSPPRQGIPPLIIEATGIDGGDGGKGAPGGMGGKGSKGHRGYSEWFSPRP